MKALGLNPAQADRFAIASHGSSASVSAPEGTLVTTPTTATTCTSASTVVAAVMGPPVGLRWGRALHGDGSVAEQDRGLTGRVGPVEIDWPMAIGYYSGIGLALAFEMMEPPLALFIAAIPFLKMLKGPGASWPTRLVSQPLLGMAKPVGGAGDGAVQPSTPDVPLERGLTIWQEARAMADRARTRR